jgi:serine phosphatase RsbU (regulator of sigma subunit)/anti-sigma regulatory factor (Ser/Thr protein kinase)
MTIRIPATSLRAVRRRLRRGGHEPEAASAAPAQRPPEPESTAIEIAPNDPIVAYFQDAGGAVDVQALELDSPALAAMKEAGVTLAVPLVSQGELIGVLNLGPRLSEQDYTADDRKLLENLAGQAGPAVRVGQLVREQEAEARDRERIEQELRVAQLIQQNFLPREVPELAGWQLAAYYRPAREVGGDFYDFIELPGDRLGLVIGDVTDKGVPAAMVMAATRTVLRASAQRLVAPGEVLEQVNELLVPDMPQKMFVTCLYAVLERETGRLRYANAGHNLPYVSTDAGPCELRATGMPLGLLPDMTYEEKEAVLGPGDTVLLHSDGLAEAHGPDREMFGFPRTLELVGRADDGQELIDSLLHELGQFTGAGWEQEDDITLVTLRRSLGAGMVSPDGHARMRVLAELSVPSAPGNERRAIDDVVAAAAPLDLPHDRLERLKTAVGEAVMNAMEHGNGYRDDAPVAVRVLVTGTRLWVHVTDHGGGGAPPPSAEPDLEAKLAGLQTPRGWGLFLIERMVDEVRVTDDGGLHTLELGLDLEGGSRGDA